MGRFKTQSERLQKRIASRLATKRLKAFQLEERQLDQKPEEKIISHTKDPMIVNFG